MHVLITGLQLQRKTNHKLGHLVPEISETMGQVQHHMHLIFGSDKMMEIVWNGDDL